MTSPISWSPDGRRLAFLRNQFRPDSSQLVVADADGTGEHTLARTPDKEAWITLFAPWRPSFGPAWSIDGQRLAVIAVNPQRGSIPLIDSRTGAREDIGVAAGTIGQVGTIDGLDWIDDRSLVLNQMTNLNVRNQMYRMPYPAGPATRLTNDPNDYVGLSLSRDRQSLVTASRHTTMEVWSGDAGGTKGKTVAERVPIPPRPADRMGRRPAVVWGIDRGEAPRSCVSVRTEAPRKGYIADAVGPAATGDGRTIAFVSARSSESNDLWTADANGRRLTQLVPGVTLQPLAITPNDHSVLYVRFEGKPVIWTVPLAGGTPTKIIDGDLAVISPNDGSIAFIATDSDNRTMMKVCSLPECASPRTLGPAAQNVPFSWTPDGGGIAFARGGNLWVQPLAGGPPRQLTRFTDSRPIGSFAWSRDGQRLAITRATVTHDIVLFRGLK